MRSLKILSAVVLSSLSVASWASAAIVVEYSTAGFPSSGTLPTSAPATTTATGIIPVSVTRGAGLVTAGLGNGFSSSNWGAGVTTLADQMTNNRYYAWGLTVDAGYKASLSTLDLNMRRSAVGAGDHYEVDASTDGFATPGTLVASWTYFGRSSGTAPGTITDGQWMTTDTAGQDAGNKITTQDLSGVAMLQNMVAGTTLSFRLYAYGGAASAANSNTIALGRTIATTPASSGGPSIGGVVTLVPEPAAMSGLGLAVLGAAARRRRVS